MWRSLRRSEDAVAMIPVCVFRAIKLPLVCLLAVEAAAVTMLPVYWSRMRETEDTLTASGNRLEAALNQEIHRATQKTLRLLAPDDTPTDAIDSSTLAQRQASEMNAAVLTEEEVERRLKETADPVAFVEYPPGTDALLDAFETLRGSFSLQTPWNLPIARLAIKVTAWEAQSRRQGSPTTTTTTSAIAPPSSPAPVAPPTEAPKAIEIQNPVENGLAVQFLWDRNVEKIEPGQSRRWEESTAWVRFDTGRPHVEPEKVELSPGLYRFELTKESGWQLRRVESRSVAQ